MDSLKPGGSGRLFPSDEAAFEIRQAQTSLPCAVKPVRPELGFDLTFHAGYEVRVPLRELAAEGDTLTTIFRVTPAGNPSTPVYFEQKWSVPSMPKAADRTAILDGAFSVGEGDYEVDWLMRDRHQRICSAYWSISVRLPTKNKQLATALAPGLIASASGDLFAEQETSMHHVAQLLRVEVLLNISPKAGVGLSPQDKQALMAILRSIAREPRIGRLSITAFSLAQNQVIFQQVDVRHINFTGLGTAIDSLKLGTISISQLADKDAEACFLIQLASEKRKRNGVDALIFLGPKVADGARMNRQFVNRLGDSACPVFYLAYDTAPESNHWPDLIGYAVRHWRGNEFIINSPLDLLSAWSKIISQLGKENRREFTAGRHE